MDFTVWIWDVEILAPIYVFTTHDSTVEQTVWNPDGIHLASGDILGWIYVWEATTGKLTRTISPLDGRNSIVYGLDWHKDGRLLAFAQGNTYTVWNFVSDDLIWSKSPEHDSITILGWSPNGELIASVESVSVFSNDGTWLRFGNLLQIRDATIGEVSISMEEAQYEFSSIDWHPDNSRLAITTIDETTLVWDWRQNKILVTFPVGINRDEDFVGYERIKNGVSWSPDGTKLAGVGSGESVYIWDAQTYELIHEIKWEGE